ncbi:MAG: EAL domain-containing protein [Gammaproteobacteria bacterium]|nr:MAG: EAL domain-containing protein [Gammaproteobacteria bacterium]
MSDDLLDFFDDEPDAGQSTCGEMPVWLILVVDDEPDVHASTKLALQGLTVCGRPLQLLHAHSAGEARQYLSGPDPIAVILLDVVMESEQTGLDMVREIREHFGRKDTRIVLRTGQPGYAPELEVIQRYDINDYKNKNELNRTRLFTTITTAVRTFQQIQALDKSRQGLEMVLQASRQLINRQGYRTFAEGVITQLAALLNAPEEGVVCCHRADEYGDSFPRIVAAAGALADFVGKSLDNVEPAQIRRLVERAMRRQCTVVEENHAAFFFRSPIGQEMVVYLEHAEHREDEILQALLKVFSTSIVTCFDNVAHLERLREIAYQDALLQVPNRQAFLAHLDEQLLAARSGRVLLADIDQFAAINDMLGTERGDQLLKVVTRRLRHKLPERCYLARVAGDTFGLFDPGGMLSPEDIAALFAEPFDLNGQKFALSITTGWVGLDGQANAAEVLAQANMAMKHAKLQARGAALCYQPDFADALQRRVELAQALREAVESRSLMLAYQPKVDLQTGRCVGLEALARWQLNGQFISPAEFIPITEATGLIGALGDWVLEQALVDISGLNSSRQSPLQVAVNVSMAQLEDEAFVDKVHATLAKAVVPATWLELEVTESMAAMDAGRLQALLTRIAELGISVAVDDFGTGFSSLGQLERMHLTTLKIDKCFVDKLALEPPDGRMCSVILQMAGELNLKVVAEGIEYENQASWLRQAGCQVGQGFFFARPMLLDELAQWLEKQA